jgi:hypothetical protein
MSIYARQIDGNKWGFFESYRQIFIDPEDYRIDEEDLNLYLKKHRFPTDKNYSQEDMIYDVTVSTGSLIIRGSKAQADWIAEMIWELM